MGSVEEATLLRIFIGESQRHGGQPLYEAIVLEARERGLSGATVLRGMLGFGAGHQLHAAKVLGLSEDLPLVVEIVDSGQRFEDFVKWLEQAVDGGLVTLEQVRVLSRRNP